ncbi:hypothetical protein ACFPVX_15870 [Cohnella faecalis]|uniref:Uncharacterized protein n=1 Tax=Cohnella faecalis TaxID=2315694 RepID=A0A398CRL4_9BACL|nr:hypothetical protein [Cohnella faecalis]RIE01554.1 hypothetical protein D3H35_24705 [Cohnella faecalis]
METNLDLINQYVKSVVEKEQLLEKLNLTVLSEQDMHKLMLLTCTINELVGRMVDAGLIQIEIKK